MHHFPTLCLNASTPRKRQLPSTLTTANRRSTTAAHIGACGRAVLRLPPLVAGGMVGAVWADEIGGYAYNPSQAGHTWNIERWYRTDR